MRRDALLAVLFLALFAALTACLAAGGPLIELDLAVHRWADAHRPPAADSVARVLNRLGQGGALLVICGLLAGWLALARIHTLRRSPGAGGQPGEPLGSRLRGWWWAAAPLLYVGAAAVLLVPTVLLLKDTTERGAPSSLLPAEQVVPLFGSLPPAEYDAGFPGGHAANTVVWYGVALLLISGLCRAYQRPEPPDWLRITLRVAPPLIVLGTTTYLSFHWLTDSLAGLALGLAIDRLLALLRSRW